MISRYRVFWWVCLGGCLFSLVIILPILPATERFNGFFSGYALNLHYQAIAVSILENRFPSGISDFTEGGNTAHYYAMHGYLPFLYPIFKLWLERELGVVSLSFIFFVINTSAFIATIWLNLRDKKISFLVTIILLFSSPPVLAAISVVGYESLSAIFLSLIPFAYSRLSLERHRSYQIAFYGLLFVYGISSWFGFYTVICLFFLRLIAPAAFFSGFKKSIGSFFLLTLSGALFVLSLMLANDLPALYQDVVARSVIAPRPYADTPGAKFILSRIFLLIFCLSIPLLLMYGVKYFTFDSQRKNNFKLDFYFCLAIIGLIFIILTLPWSLRHPHSWTLAIIPWYLYCANSIPLHWSKVVFGNKSETLLRSCVILLISVILILLVVSIRVAARGEELLTEARLYLREGKAVCVSNIFPCDGQPKSLFFRLSKNDRIYFSECPADRRDHSVSKQSVETVCSNGRLLFLTHSD